MNRRQLLHSGAAGVVLGLAGCSSLSDLTGGGANAIGESAEYRNLRVAPDDYMTSSTIVLERNSGNNTEKTAPQGATYLLTRLTVEHEGDAERVFPARGRLSLQNNWIKVFYDGEQTESLTDEARFSAIEADSRQLPSYHHAIRQNGYDSGVYEGSAVGWLVDVIPEGFAPGDATIEITWGSDSYVGVDESDIKTFTWTYSSE